MTGHGGWPMTVVLDHEGGPFFAGTYFPDRPRHGQPSFRQVLEAVADAWSEPRRRGPPGRRPAPRAPRPRARPRRPAPSTRRCSRRAVDRPGARLRRASTAASAARRSSRRRWCSSSCCGSRPASRRPRRAADGSTGRSRRWPAAASTTSSAAASRATASTAAWVVPHFEKMLYDNAQLLGVYARRDDRGRRPRRAEDTADFVLRELGTAEGGFASALDADSEGAEGKFYAWTPAQLVAVLGRGRRRRGRPSCSAVTEAGTFEHGTSTLQLRVDPDDAERLARVRDAAAGRPRRSRVRPARDDKVVAAWNGLAISGLCDSAVTLLGRARATSAAAVAAGELLVDVHLGRRPAAPGVARRRAGPHAGVLEDHGCVAAGFLALLQATGDAALARAAPSGARGGAHPLPGRGRRLPRHRGRRGGAGRPAARPLRQREPVRAVRRPCTRCSTYAALTGSGRHREAAEQALATTAALAAHAPRFAGWSLAAAVAMLEGPREIAVVGPPGAARDALARAARRDPARGGRGRRGVTGGARDPAAHRTDDRRRRARGVRLSSPGLRASGHRSGAL